MPAANDPRVVKLIRPGTPPAPKAPEPEPPKKAARGKAKDWPAIELAYRTGKFSNRQLGDQFHTSHTAIQTRAKDGGWTRDLSARVEQRVETKIIEAELSKTLSMETLPAREVAIVEVKADIIAKVRIGRRERFGRWGALTTQMFEAMEQTFKNRESLETLGQLMDQSTPDAVDKLNDIYMQAIALPGQVKALKDLTDVMVRVSDAEAKEFKLDKAPEGNDQSRTSLPIRFVESLPPPVSAEEDEE